MNPYKKLNKQKAMSEENLIKALQSIVNMPDGGFIIPPLNLMSESTSVKPIIPQQLAKSTVGQARINELQDTSLTLLPNGKRYFDSGIHNSNKAPNDTFRFREKSLGGNILSTAASFIPGIGPILQPLIGLGDQLISQSKTVPEKQLIEQQPNNNIYGNFAKGGFVNEGFKQYNTGTHTSGNDLPIDQNGNPGSTSVAAVQGKENSFVIDGKPFIMSDTLSNPLTGNTFNVDAAQVNKEHKNAAYIPEQKNSLNFKMKKLATLNNALKSLTESSNQMYAGGPVPRRVNPNGREYNLITDAPDAIEQPMLNNDLNVPLATDPFGFKTNLDYLPGNYTVDDPSNLATDSTTFGTELTAPTPSSTNSTPVDRGGEGIVSTAANVVSNVAQPWNGIALGLKGLGLAKSVFDATQGAEVEQPILPNYQKADQYVKSANIDYTQARQDAMGVSNIAAGSNRSLSSNAAQFQGREQARLASLQDAVSGISQQENNARSALNMQRGQYEQGKAVDTANRLSQNRINNQQNAANSRFAGEKLFSEISNIGTEFNQYGETQKQIANNKELQQFYTTQGLALLNSKFSNFELSSDIVERLKSGKATIDDLVVVKNIVDKKGK